MVKDELREKEPIAYISLKNILERKRLAHSFLFSGEKNPLKTDTAYLLAQSIIEGNNDFACEECDTCKRIRNNSYFDVIYINGYDSSVKKDYVDKVMSQFNKTALEKSGKKVYIIDNVNNASLKTLNMILKFMEEPSNDNTYGIFITDLKEDLLPTIKSRCLEIPFVTRDFSYVTNEYLNAGFDDTDAYLLSHIHHEYIDIELNDPSYLRGKEYVYKTIDNLNNLEYLPVMFYKEMFVSLKTDELRKSADYYIDIMLKMIEDAIENNVIDDNEYNAYLNRLRKYDLTVLLDIFIDKKNKVLKAAERKLLFDAAAYEMLSYIK